MKDIQQLIKKNNQGGGYGNIFPLTFLDAVKDKATGAILKDILAGFNVYFLAYTGSPETTRLTVPTLLRRKGLIIVYITYDDLLITEQYTAVPIDNITWQNSNNWKQLWDQSQLEDFQNKSVRYGYNVTAFGMKGGTHTIETAVNDVPPPVRVLGHKITFAEQDRSWGTYQFQSLALADYTDPTKWVKLEGIHNVQTLNITNQPDEEDITTNGGELLKFADKEYSTESFSGLGRVFLRKNIVGEVNILTQDMLAKTDTIYHIQYDYDLNGQSIIVPDRCILEFEGGSISNGVVMGTNTDIKTGNLSKIFNNISITGTWKVSTIHSNWFDFDFTEKANNQVNLQNLCNLTSDSFQGTIYIAPMTIWTSTDKPNGSVMTPNSNTHIILDAVINLNTNDYTHYDMIYCIDKDNIQIEGSGTIAGDLRTHTGTTGEFGFCIHFLGVKNGSVKNLNLIEAWGDSISVDSSTTRRSENIHISGLYCTNSRRQGLSVEGAKDVYVKDCVFEGIFRGISGTFPGAAVDVEPWREGDVAENIYIENCTATNCYKGFVASGTSKNVIFSKCYAHNSTCQTHNFSDEIVQFRDCNFNGILYCNSCNVQVSNSHINQILFGTNPKNYSFTNCHIGGSNLQEVLVGSASRGLVCKSADATFGNNAVFNFMQCTFEPVLRTADNVSFDLTWSDIPENLKVNFYNCQILPIGNNVINRYANLYNSLVRTNRFSLNRTCPYTIELIGNTFIQDSGDSFFQIDFDSGNDTLLFRAYNNSFIVQYPWYYFAYDPSSKKIEFVNNTFSVVALRVYQSAITQFYKKFSADSIIQFNRILPNITQGTTEERPSVGADNGGFSYYDTTLKKSILWNGTAWVNMDGTALT